MYLNLLVLHLHIFLLLLHLHPPSWFLLFLFTNGLHLIWLLLLYYYYYYCLIVNTFFFLSFLILYIHIFFFYYLFYYWFFFLSFNADNINLIVVVNGLLIEDIGISLWKQHWLSYEIDHKIATHTDEESNKGWGERENKNRNLDLIFYVGAKSYCIKLCLSLIDNNNNEYKHSLLF